MKRSGAIQQPVPRTLEQDQAPKSLPIRPTAEIWMDGQQAFLDLLKRANRLAYAASQDDLLRQTLSLIAESARPEPAICFHLDNQKDEMVVSVAAGDERGAGLFVRASEEIIRPGQRGGAEQDYPAGRWRWIIP